MRIWYVVGEKEYWLEPDFTYTKRGTFRVLGCRLLDTNGRYKGYWHWPNVPLETKRHIRTEVGAYLKRLHNVEEREKRILQTLHRKTGKRD